MQRLKLRATPSANGGKPRKRPLTKLEVMEREMEQAIAGELYERAAELRDAIRLLKAADRA